MSIRKVVLKNKEKKNNKKDKKSNFEWAFIGNSPNPVTNVVKALNSVDVSSSDAQRNAHSISDNNGGRIELNEDGEQIIKK